MKVNIPILMICIAAAVTSCGNSNDGFDACGQFEATEVTVSAESNGKITSLSIEEGDFIEKGSMAGIIDTVQTYLQKKELEARKRNTMTKAVDIDIQVASQEAKLANLKTDYARYMELLSKNAGTRKQVDDIESQIRIAENEIKALKENYTRNNAGIKEEIAIYDVQIAQKEDMLRKCRITAPISGTVLTKYAEEGEMTTTGKALFKMADISNIYVKAYFTTKQLEGIKLGQKVTVTAEDGSNDPKTFEGTVTWISEEAEFTPKNIQTRDERADLVYAVKISVKNEDGSLRTGMYSYVKLH